MTKRNCRIQDISQDTKIRLLTFLIKLSWADGKIEEKEMNFLFEMRRKLELEENYDKAIKKEIIDPASKPEILNSYKDLVKEMESQKKSEAELKEVIADLLISDGTISDDESAILKEIKRINQNIDPTETKNIIFFQDYIAKIKKDEHNKIG